MMAGAREESGGCIWPPGVGDILSQLCKAGGEMLKPAAGQLEAQTSPPPNFTPGLGGDFARSPQKQGDPHIQPLSFSR